jgi:Domain of unknown function (DUF4387)/Acyclic terpene utilisation family protein AtuA
MRERVPAFDSSFIFGRTASFAQAADIWLASVLSSINSKPGFVLVLANRSLPKLPAQKKYWFPMQPYPARIATQGALSALRHTGCLCPYRRWIFLIEVEVTQTPTTEMDMAFRRVRITESRMAKSAYRVTSVCGALGTGIGHLSLQMIMSAGSNAFVVNASAAQSHAERTTREAQPSRYAAILDDLRTVIETGLTAHGPIIIGNCGTFGTNGDVDELLEVARTVFARRRVSGVKVAVIRSEVDPEVVIDAMRASALSPLDNKVNPDEAALRDSNFVGQMGIHPILTALVRGAKYVIAARACGASLFAADMIRHGIPSGLAYHAGQILANAALIDEPGLPPQGLRAEISEDGKAVFRATHSAQPFPPYSLAAHSQNGREHPYLHVYPEGVLTTHRTEFFAIDAHAAGLRSSFFYRGNQPGSPGIKLDGARHGAFHVADKWTLHHLLQNELTVRQVLFPIEYFDVNGDDWHQTDQSQPIYFELGEPAGVEDLDERTLSAIEDAPPRAASHGIRRLSSITRAIRRSTPGPHRLTVDIFFASEEEYEMALRSNLFCVRRLAKALDIERSLFIGTYFVDACNAIKVTLERPAELTAPHVAEMFDLQLQSRIEGLVVPEHTS